MFTRGLGAVFDATVPLFFWKQRESKPHQQASEVLRSAVLHGLHGEQRICSFCRLHEQKLSGRASLGSGRQWPPSTKEGARRRKEGGHLLVSPLPFVYMLYPTPTPPKFRKLDPCPLMVCANAYFHKIS